MRTRKDIEAEVKNSASNWVMMAAQLEVLLDIRDLLTPHLL